MALLVTLFLVLVNIFNAITTNSPKADGLNALQVRQHLHEGLGDRDLHLYEGSRKRTKADLHSCL